MSEPTALDRWHAQPPSVPRANLINPADGASGDRVLISMGHLEANGTVREVVDAAWLVVDRVDVPGYDRDGWPTRTPTDGVKVARSALRIVSRGTIPPSTET